MEIASSLFPVSNGVTNKKIIYAVRMPEIINLKNNTIQFHTAAADTFYQQYNW